MACLEVLGPGVAEEAREAARHAGIDLASYVVAAVSSKVCEDEHCRAFNPDGRAWTFSAPLNEVDAKRLLAASRAGDTAGFVRAAILEKLERAGEGSGLRPAIAMPSAPSGDYLGMVQQRLAAGQTWSKLPIPAVQIIMPGYSAGQMSGREAFELLTLAIALCADSIRIGLAQRTESVWERAELEEVLMGAEAFAGAGFPEKLTEDGACRTGWGPWSNRTPRELAVHEAFLLKFHAAKIGEFVLPAMNAMDADRLASALVLAEALVAAYSDRRGEAGTISAPTAIQRQAWEYRARMWQGRAGLEDCLKPIGAETSEAGAGDLVGAEQRPEVAA